MPERAATRTRMLPILVGNLFEWFDYTLYGFFATTIAHQFFPPGNEEAAMLAVAATFGVAFVMRPIGAVVFGLIGDGWGRKTSLTLTFALMALGQSVAKRSAPLILVLGVAGAAFFYGDAVITPAISVLSAMEGLKLVTPAFDHFILPMTLAILVGLFAIQRRGTESIGRLFGPVMVTWFAVIGLLGAINIWAAPEILKAFNPVEGIGFVAANPVVGFAVMGGVFLALTGAEALYADMGHVGPTAIRRAWFGLVLPALLPQPWPG